METPAGKRSFQPEGQKVCVWWRGGCVWSPSRPPLFVDQKQLEPHGLQEGNQAQGSRPSRGTAWRDTGQSGTCDTNRREADARLGLGQPSFVSIIQYESLDNYLCPLWFKNTSAEIRKNRDPALRDSSSVDAACWRSAPRLGCSPRPHGPQGPSSVQVTTSSKCLAQTYVLEPQGDRRALSHHRQWWVGSCKHIHTRVRSCVLTRSQVFHAYYSVRCPWTNQGEGEQNETVWTSRAEPPWEGRAWGEAGAAALGPVFSVAACLFPTAGTALGVLLSHL